MIAHHAFFLEPLTYVSAWIFEERGFAYSKGHQLMDTIHKEFQPGNELHKALDGSTPFRQPDQWKTVRGRAGAITVRILIPWPETFIWISLAVTLWFPTWSAVTFLPKVKKSR